jgi:hypothetical protein
MRAKKPQLIALIKQLIVQKLCPSQSKTDFQNRFDSFQSQRWIKNI